MLALGLASLGAVAAARLLHAAPTTRGGLCCRLPAELHDGDLVFRRGSDLVSHVVLTGEGRGHFSHVGVIVTWSGRPSVVHAVPAEGASAGGVVVEPLEAFAASSEAESVAFAELPSLDAGARQRVRRYVLAQVGKPFDAAFRFSSERRFYCTALALKALRAGGADLTTQVPTLHFALLDEAVYAPDDLFDAAALHAITPRSIPTGTHF